MFSTQAPAALGLSIPDRARKAGLVEWHATNIRDFADNKHAKTDDRPFGGGPGMVMACQPVYDAVMAVEKALPQSPPPSPRSSPSQPPARILLTPQGVPLTQSIVEDLATKSHLLLIAGHYEGIDERVIQKLAPMELSLGDFVISGGELAALVLMDAIIRLLSGALGDHQSAHQDSFGIIPTTNPNNEPINTKTLKHLGISPDTRLLDCPHYTRPRVWQGMEIPEVLLSGDHEAVARWRLEQMLERTRQRRPDLLD